MLIYWLSEYLLVLKIVKWNSDIRHFRKYKVVFLKQNTRYNNKLNEQVFH
jgi:hypothetical protein